MDLLTFCSEKYNSDNRDKYNGVEFSAENIKKMLYLVIDEYRSGLSGDTSWLPSNSDLISMEVSDNGDFQGRRASDVVGLVFDVVTQENRNPNLWYKTDINSQISHTFNKLFHGPLGSISPSGKGPVTGKTYEVVKMELIKSLALYI